MSFWVIGKDASYNWDADVEERATLAEGVSDRSRSNPLSGHAAMEVAS